MTMINEITFGPREGTLPGFVVWVEFDFAEEAYGVGAVVKNTPHGWSALDPNDKCLGIFASADLAAHKLAGHWARGALDAGRALCAALQAAGESATRH